MTRTEALETIRRHAGDLLLIHFTKRTDGTHRRMLCIFNPEAAERQTFRFNPAARGLVPVWDVEKGARRFVNLDGVQSIQAMRTRPRRDRAPMPRNPRTPRFEHVEPRTWEEARMEAHQLF